MHFLAALKVAIFLTTSVAALTNVCPSTFLRYSSNHTYCKAPNPACNILQDSVSPDLIPVILNEHNRIRSNIANGKEINFPGAANMLQMVWDDELADLAQKHATQCDFNHDCPNCRRVKNFGVGQNLAIQYTTGNDIPKPNWPMAIKGWYDEKPLFPLSAISSYIDPSSSANTWGHFAQVIWAKSWRIGCGYALYRGDSKFNQLYVCNYGPAGNTAGKSTYEVGTACSTCPSNFPCSLTTSKGLCDTPTNGAPIYMSQRKYIFYCDFHKQPDCQSTTYGKKDWFHYITLSDTYIGNVLKGGEESTILFNRTIKATQPSFCVVISYRKGPNVDGEEDANIATETFRIMQNNYEVKKNIPTFKKPFVHQFSQYSVGLRWNMDTQVQLTFAVPPGKPDQFFEIEKVYAVEGACP